jgi:hypothetical protein
VNAGPAINSQGAWDALNARLPELIEELWHSEPFYEGKPPPKSGRGIYLFSHGLEPMYVGRTGITARARKTGKEPSTNFYQRWSQHRSEGSSPSSAPFAFKIAMGNAEAFGVPTPRELKESGAIKKISQWWSLRETTEEPEFCAVFEEAKAFIRDELDFRCVEIVDDVRGVFSHVAEVYADVILKTHFGDFSTS